MSRDKINPGVQVFCPDVGWKSDSDSGDTEFSTNSEGDWKSMDWNKSTARRQFFIISSLHDNNWRFLVVILVIIIFLVVVGYWTSFIVAGLTIKLSKQQ